MERIEAKLSTVGFDPQTEAIRLRALDIGSHYELGKNLSGYEREYLQDRVTSYYPYFLVEKSGTVRISSKEGESRDKYIVESQIDPEERDGLTLEGWRAFEEKIVSAPNGSFFTWISPRGSAGTTGEFAKTTYPYHQVYVGQIKDRMIDTWALKCDMDESDLALWLSEISGTDAFSINVSDKYFLMNPAVSDYDPLSHLQMLITKYGIQTPFYKEKTLQDAVAEMAQNKGQTSKTVVRIMERVYRQMQDKPIMTVEEIKWVTNAAYVELLRSYQDLQGNVHLKGGCGGSFSINDFFDKQKIDFGLTIPKDNSFSVFSTDFRMKTAQSSVESIKSCPKIKCKECGWEAKSTDFKDGHLKYSQCPECGWMPS
jgi:hypothetical protein